MVFIDVYYCCVFEVKGTESSRLWEFSVIQQERGHQILDMNIDLEANQSCICLSVQCILACFGLNFRVFFF